MSLSATATAFTGNVAGLRGGAIATGAGNASLASCALVQNYAFDAGGGAFCDGPLQVVNSSLVSNGAGGDGGGLFASGDLTLLGAPQTQLLGNLAGSKGAAIYVNASTSVVRHRTQRSDAIACDRMRSNAVDGTLAA